MIRALAWVACLGFASGAAAQDWNGFADVETVQVVTSDEDGKPRDTTVWLAVYEGHGFVRTGGTRWGRDVRRDPDVEVRIGDQAFPLRATQIPTEDPLYAAVADVFRRKYGFTDRAMSILRNLSGPAMILRLDPR